MYEIIKATAGYIDSDDDGVLKYLGFIATFEGNNTNASVEISEKFKEISKGSEIELLIKSYETKDHEGNIKRTYRAIAARFNGTPISEPPSYDAYQDLRHKEVKEFYGLD
jgi:hypothetical protein